MAIQTENLGIIPDASGLEATLSYLYDDVTLLITEIDIVNNTAMGAFASGTQVFTDAQGNVTYGKNYHTTVPAGQSQLISPQKGQTNQLQLKVDANHPNRLDGVEWAFYLV